MKLVKWNFISRGLVFGRSTPCWEKGSSFSPLSCFSSVRRVQSIHLCVTAPWFCWVAALAFLSRSKKWFLARLVCEMQKIHPQTPLSLSVKWHGGRGTCLFG